MPANLLSDLEYLSARHPSFYSCSHGLGSRIMYSGQCDLCMGLLAGAY